MTATEEVRADAKANDGMLAPLRLAAFRRMWMASLFSNFGSLIQGVGAAWVMTQLTSKVELVALVQAAQAGPVLLFALMAGAIADMYDRRIVALVALGIAFSGSCALTILDLVGVMTPAVLLVCVAVTGVGVSLLSPSWQAAVREQVPIETLPAAVALNAISYNIARSFGPAIGGVIVAVAGAVAAFAANAASYLPMIYAMVRWKRLQEPARLPPEGLARAIVSGVRYVMHSPPIRNVLVRVFLTALLGTSVTALLPLVARNLLHGDAKTFGLLLGAFGVGAVSAALNITRLRKRFSAEAMVRGCNVLLGVGASLIGLSTSLPLTATALFIAGAGWMLSVNECNIAIQISAPRWVTGRALATYQAGMAGGISLGAWLWGHVAELAGVRSSLILSAMLLVLLPLAGLWLRLPSRGQAPLEAQPPTDPEVALALTERSGPVRIEIEYNIDPKVARKFYGLMQEIRTVRSRSGGYGWSLARDIARPERWIESYTCPTWLDYLRQRTRATHSERELQAKVMELQDPAQPNQVRRWLVRPFGSVRWKDNSPDGAGAAIASL